VTHSFTAVRKGEDGTWIRGRKDGAVVVTHSVIDAGANSRVESDPHLWGQETQVTAVTEENARKMIAFIKTLALDTEAKEVGMYEIDEELPDEAEFEESGDDYELELDDDDRELGEADDDGEFEVMGEVGEEGDEAMEHYARRLYEIAQREFEHEPDLDREIDRALDQMEAEYFVRRVKRNRKTRKGKGIFGNILRAGAKLVGKVASKLPIGSLVKAGTSLVRGDLKGAVKNLGKAAVGTIGTAVLGPAGGALATSALDALAPDKELGPRRRRRIAIRRVARITRDAYRELADNLPEQMDHPYVAHEAATQAVRKAMLKNRLGPRGLRPVAAHPRAGARVVRLSPGETIVVKA
jgi:hypothetical protein